MPVVMAGLFAFALLLLTLRPTLVQAAQQVDLYSVEQLVSDNSARERAKMAKSGLENVYRKITGDPAIMRRFSGLSRFSAQAQNYLQTYSYRSVRAESSEASRELLLLKLSYAPNAVRQHLREVNAPFWSAERPELEVQLLQRSLSSDGVPVTLLNRANQPGVAEDLSFIAEQKGIPLRFASSRRFTKTGESAQSIWEESDAEAAVRAKNLAADATLYGRISEISPSVWQAKWILTGSGVFVQSQTNANSRFNLLNQGLELAQINFSQRFASRLGPLSSGRDNLSKLVTIKGLRSASDYLALRKYLDSIQLFEGFQIKSQQGDQLKFSVSSDISTSQIAALLTRSRKLASSEGIGDSLAFVWLGS